MPAERSITANIRPQQTIDRSDRAIAELARPQHHVLTLAQLEEIGLSPRAVRHRAAAGRLTRLHRGVYGVGRPSQHGRWLAAVLACGDGSVLSHRSAAQLWGLASRDSGRTHVTTPARTGRFRAGLVVHGGTLAAPETAIEEGIPCTSVSRTLLDLAGSVDRRRLERAIDRTELLRLFDLDDLRAVVERHAGRRGIVTLREVLASYDGPSITASEAEERLLALIRRAALPRPEVNSSVAVADGTVYRPDFFWRDHRLIVEVDGRDYHARRRSFERDRLRDRQLALAGYETRRFAAAEVLRHPKRVTEEIAAFLALSWRSNGR
jgi:very-short-patch-repair endonuclease